MITFRTIHARHPGPTRIRQKWGHYANNLTESIEYQTPEHELARIDLELANEHYRFKNIGQKIRAGFSIYARAQEASNLRRVLDQHELIAEILSL